MKSFALGVAVGLLAVYVIRQVTHPVSMFDWDRYERELQFLP